jgi:2-dehydro-3-deoxyglucarate aldolase
MRKKSLKQYLFENRLTYGSWITIGHPSIAEIMAKAGFEWLVIDMEHSAISTDQCQELIRVIDLCGISPLVRVSANDSLLIKKAMDAGSHGVIVPAVNSREDAEKAVLAVRYPPYGIRGVGLSRAQGYGTTFNEYKKWVEEESIVIVQIEHIKAVKNLKQILTVEGVDAFIIGPYDLSGSLGIPGKFEDKKMLRALEEVKQVAAENNISAGYHVIPPQPELVLEKINEGYTFIAYSVDFLFLGESCRSGLREIQDSTKAHTKKNKMV